MIRSILCSGHKKLSKHLKKSRIVKHTLSTSKLLIVLLISTSILVSGFFISPVFENAHLWYIRSLARDVVEIRDLEETRGGTGFIVKGKSGTRYVLTNHHICQIAKQTGGKLVVTYRGIKSIVTVVKHYPLNDLCVTTAPEGADSELKLAGKVYSGERVYSIGHPYLEGNTVTQGELSSNVSIHVADGVNVDPKDCSGPTYELIDLSKNPMALMFGVFNQCIRTLSAISSSVNIMPGNSGSPTVDMYGHVVAVVFAANESGSHSYHVPLSAIQEFLGEL